MMRWVAVFLLLPLTSCHFCTLMYVPDGVAITFDAPGGWAAGQYRVEAEGQVFEVALPIAASTKRRVAPSDAGTQSLSSLVVDNAGTGLDMLFLENGTPETVEVSVQLNGAELVKQTLTPTYSQFEPNGVGCGVTRTGSAQLEL